MQDQVPSWAIWVPVASTLVGGLISLLTTWLTNLHNRQIDEIKLRKELILKIALEDWKNSYEIAAKSGKSVAPLETYVMHMNCLADLIFSSDRISEEEYIKRVRHSFNLIDAHKRMTDERKQSSIS